jgi:hypothetical protein
MMTDAAGAAQGDAGMQDEQPLLPAPQPSFRGDGDGGVSVEADAPLTFAAFQAYEERAPENMGDS